MNETTTYVVIEEQVFLTNTMEEIAEAQTALREAGIASASVYVGEPDGLGESYRNGQFIFADAPPTAAALYDHKTGEHLRPATSSEAEASRRAAKTDGGHGVIVVDGRSCYVQD